MMQQAASTRRGGCETSQGQQTDLIHLTSEQSVRGRGGRIEVYHRRKSITTTNTMLKTDAENHRGPHDEPPGRP